MTSSPGGSATPLRTAVLWLATLVLAAGCGPGGGEPGESDRSGQAGEAAGVDESEDGSGSPAGLYATPPSILLVTIDTLRADHLGAYGYPRATSPRLDALASEGIRFERAISVAGTTLPSHLSLLTGLLPHQHGFTANLGAIAYPFRPSAGIRPAPVFLEDAGYRTAAFISGTTVKRSTGIAAGFETFDQPETVNRLGAETVGRALEWLQRQRGQQPDEPVFLWVHLWDPHEPNDPPEPFASAFQVDEALEQIIAERRIDAELLEQTFSPLELARLFWPELIEPLARKQEVEVPELTQADVERLLNLYDGDVLYADTQVGKLLDGLETLGMADSTLVAVTADHGQSLGQGNWLEHGRITHENVHVPLILRLPGDLVPQPAVVERVVSGIDVLSTLLARIDLPQARSFLRQSSGRDLFDGAPAREFAFSHRAERDREHWEPGRKFGLSFGEWRYYHLEEGEDLLFDLGSDPFERQDRSGERPDRVEQLEDRVRGILSERPAPPRDESGEPIDTEEAARLEAEMRALGYVGEDDG